MRNLLLIFPLKLQILTCAPLQFESIQAFQEAYPFDLYLNPRAAPQEAREPKSGRLPQAAANQSSVTGLLDLAKPVCRKKEICRSLIDDRCHSSFKTVYTSHEEKSCTEGYKKACSLEMEDEEVAEEGVVCSLRPKTDCHTKEGFGEEEMLCRPAHESSCWSKVVVSQEETSVPVCSVVWEELCKVAALTDSYQKCDGWPRRICSLALGRRQLRRLEPPHCQRVQTQVCGSRTCELEEVCREEQRKTIRKVPREMCRLKVEPKCHTTRKLVPQLKEHKTCNKVPRIVCKEESDCAANQEKP